MDIKHADLVDELDWCIRKLKEVALDLREMLNESPRSSSVLHQADKIDEVVRKLTGEEPQPQDAPPVHGGGTGNK